MEEPFTPACAKPREIAIIKFLSFACLKIRYWIPPPIFTSSLK